MAAKKENTADFDRKWAHLIKKTASDPTLKQRLLNNPEQVLREHGIEFTKGITVKVHENSNKVVHLTLPMQQVAQDLSEEEIRKVAGGRLTIVLAHSPDSIIRKDDLGVMSF